MSRRVQIEIEGTQRYPEQSEVETISYSTTGELYQKGDKYYLIYKEGKDTGLDGATTTVKVQGEQVVMKRIGPGGVRQSFRTGELDHCLYKTPQGNFSISLLPLRVEVDLTDKGGSINLEYELKVAQETLSYNQLWVVVSQVN